MNYDRWSSIPESEKAPIRASLQSKFDYVGAPTVVESVIDRKMATLLRDHTYRLHKEWQNLVVEHGEAYAREHNPRNCTPDKWTGLIDKKWKTDKFKALSSRNKASRAVSKLNHTSGSRSIASRAYDVIQENDGNLNFPEFYRETHYNAKKKKWCTSECEILHSQMTADTAESQTSSQNADYDVIPLTAEQMSARYLGTRAGIVKGIGMRPSSVRQIESGSSSSSQQEVETLRDQLESQRLEMLAALEAEREQRRDMQSQMDTVMEFMRKMGHYGPPPPPDGSAGCGLAS